MAAMALRLSGYKGKVVLHTFLTTYSTQKAFEDSICRFRNWLIKRADTIVGTTPVYMPDHLTFREYRNTAAHLSESSRSSATARGEQEIRE